MGLLSKAKSAAKSAANEITKIGNALGKAEEQEADVQEKEEQTERKMNKYKELEGKTEKAANSGESDAADRYASEIEEGEEQVINRLESVDEELIQILQEEMQGAELIAEELSEREDIENRIKRKIGQVAEKHENFDEELKASVENLKEYLRESKDSSGQMYRGETGRATKVDKEALSNKNWQELTREAEYLKDSVESIIKSEEAMREEIGAEEKSLERFEKDWKKSLKEVKEFEKELNTFVGEEKELDKIAKEIGDKALDKKIVHTEHSAEQLEETVKKMKQEESKVDDILSKIEGETEGMMTVQKNTLEKAEAIHEMSENALPLVEEAEKIVLSNEGEFSDVSFKSEGNWKAEIQEIEDAMKSVDKLVQKFEKIEEEDIREEEKEESMVETEIQQGKQALGD